jgi:hypothetical protein
MAGGGSYGNFCNPKFVQQWSHFMYSVLNMGPQLVHNAIRKSGYQILVPDAADWWIGLLSCPRAPRATATHSANRVARRGAGLGRREARRGYCESHERQRKEQQKRATSRRRREWRKLAMKARKKRWVGGLGVSS